MGSDGVASADMPSAEILDKVSDALLLNIDNQEEAVVILGQLQKIVIRCPPDDPRHPAPGLLASSILHTLRDLIDKCAALPDVGGQYNFWAVALSDAVAAVVHALLQPAVHSYLGSVELGIEPTDAAHAYRGWGQVLSILLGSGSEHQSSYRVWLSRLSAAMFHSKTGIPITYPSQRSAPHGGLGDLPLLPSAATMLALSSISLLLLALNHAASPSLLVADPVTCRPMALEQAAEKLVQLLATEDNGLTLPDGAVSNVLFTLLLEGRGEVCKLLVRSSEAIKTLGGPLERLAADAGAWRVGPYAYHVQVLAYLCQWTASRLGLADMQLLLGLASVTVAALDSLLRLEPANERDGASSLVRVCLVLLTHLASATRVRSFLARSGCLHHWLELAALWQSQPQVLQHLVLLARAPLVDYGREPYFSPLFRDQGWCFDMVNAQGKVCSTWPLVLEPLVIARLADLLQHVPDATTKALLVDTLARALDHARTCKPAYAALLAAAQPPQAFAMGGRSGVPGPSGDLELYVGLLGLVGEVSQQQALAVALACCQREQQLPLWRMSWEMRLTVMNLTSHLPQDALLVLLGWMKYYLDGLQAGNRDPAARLAFLSNLDAQLRFGMVPFEAIIDHRVLERCLLGLRYMQSAEEVSVVFRVVQAILAVTQIKAKEQPDKVTDLHQKLILHLGAPPALHKLLLYLSEQLEPRCRGAASWPIPGLVPQDFQQEWEEDVLGPGGMLRAFSILLKAARSWVRFLDHHHDAVRMLLMCRPLWEHAIEDRQMLHINFEVKVDVLDGTVDFLRLLTSRDPHGELGRMAQEVMVSLTRSPRLSPPSSPSSLSDEEASFDDVLRPMGADDTKASGSGSMSVLDRQQVALGRRSAGVTGASNGSSSGCASSVTGAGGASAGAATVGRGAAAGSVAGREGPVCGACHKPAEKLLSCSRCKTMQYCSKTCQQMDWKQHKQQCCKG